jgi:hypothetical protein
MTAAYRRSRHSDNGAARLALTFLDEIRAELAVVGVDLRDDAYLFSNDPAQSRPWNPDWATHKVAEAPTAAKVKLDIKGGRPTASQLPAGGFRPAEHRCPPQP